MLTPYPSRPTKQAHELDGKFLSVVVPIYNEEQNICLLYTSPSPRDLSTSRMPSSA